MKFSKPAVLALRLRVFSCLGLAGLPSCSPTSPPQSSLPSISMSDQAYVGLTKEAASAKAEAAGLRWRLAKVDGKSQRVTKDHRPERLNFDIERGIVTRVTKG